MAALATTRLASTNKCLQRHYFTAPALITPGKERKKAHPSTPVHQQLSLCQNPCLLMKQPFPAVAHESAKGRYTVRLFMQALRSL